MFCWESGEYMYLNWPQFPEPLDIKVCSVSFWILLVLYGEVLWRKRLVWTLAPFQVALWVLSWQSALIRSFVRFGGSLACNNGFLIELRKSEVTLPQKALVSVDYLSQTTILWVEHGHKMDLSFLVLGLDQVGWRRSSLLALLSFNAALSRRPMGYPLSMKLRAIDFMCLFKSVRLLQILLMQRNGL